MWFPAPTWARAVGPDSQLVREGRLESALRSQEGNRRTLLLWILVSFVKVLNLPTNPFPTETAHGDLALKVNSTKLPTTDPTACGGDTVAWVTPVSIHGATSLFSPCDTACTV